eukprot:CAMPEP_0197607984 /NCGR_PEP_ID=MMETSP1326-20131121/48172_1 /TAXON_ID=1155430 /ORGANISM="Genus nov. species nov., Strain RCC2288" /LENGTH=95 /DNA_ID=CAMNT_0043176121 /DNA_START=440 /DNA_END=723 /DNA_ORIENTATION=+
MALSFDTSLRQSLAVRPSGPSREGIAPTNAGCSHHASDAASKRRHASSPCSASAAPSSSRGTMLPYARALHSSNAAAMSDMAASLSAAPGPVSSP